MLGLLVRNRRGGARATRRERVLLVGEGPASRVAARNLLRRPGGVALVGLLSEEVESEVRAGPSLERLGSPHELKDVCGSHGVDRVVLAAPSLDGGQLLELIEQADAADVNVSLLPWVMDPAARSPLGNGYHAAVLGADPGTPPRPTWFLKRALGIVVSAAALILALPLLLIAAIAIKLDSPGPVFFVHERVGRHGRRFKLLKLRTMVPDAERRVEELRAASAHPAWLLLDNDPRVTRVGRVLRRTSIDELPQLVNVILGQMSLVGPRPLPPYEDGQVTGWGRRRLDFPPGITGLWQVLGRVDIPFEEMIKLDYLYVTNWTLRGDVVLLLRTIQAVLSRRGAN